MLALRCVDAYPAGNGWTEGRLYPVHEEAEHDALTGQLALRWVCAFNDDGALIILDRDKDGLYRSRCATFDLTLNPV